MYTITVRDQNDNFIEVEVESRDGLILEIEKAHQDKSWDNFSFPEYILLNNKKIPHSKGNCYKDEQNTYRIDLRS